MDQIIAVCGLICTDCPAYQATQAQDQAWLERVTAEWRQQFNAPDLPVEAVSCNGCLAEGQKQCTHCGECSVRLCALERGVLNCGVCPDYGCEKITSLLAFMPEVKPRLDAIHAAL